MSPSDKIALFSAIGGWVSGIATVSAVGISLYLANRKPKINIKCRIGFRVIIGRSYVGKDIREDGLSITIANQSVVPITVNSIHWEFGRETVLHQMFGDSNSASVPKKLEYGDEALFWIKNEDDDWFNGFVAKLKEQNPKIRKFKCCVNLSTGQTFSFKPDKAFMDKLSRHIRQEKNHNSATGGKALE
ncbi:hypothetical protein [Serratia ureilytica]|uniref:hypothetical protein n=1 Tax=Serratia ureilytica TaxID=300181 RepID=UPI00186907C7|nr:hypothetical protein [Serratia ureilytica]